MARMTREEFDTDEYIQSALPDMSQSFMRRYDSLDRWADCIEYLGTIGDAQSMPETLEILMTAFDRLTQHLASEVEQLNSDVDTVKKVVDYVRMKDIGALDDSNT